MINEMDKDHEINLRELFITPTDELPNWINSENVIYKITNNINGHAYIGQAKWFYGRFVANNRWSHLGSLRNSSQYLYNAIKKYKSRNFTVTIIESDLDDLNFYEEYWIRELHTCIYDPNYKGGYNMTFGGQDCSNLRTTEVQKRRESSIARSYNGDNAGQLHTDEVVRKCIKNAHTPEAEEKRKSTNRDNHKGVLAWNTESSIKKSQSTRAKTDPTGRGDCMHACHSQSAVNSMLTTKLERYGTKAVCHTKQALINQGRSQSVGKLIKFIKINIQRLIDSNLELTYENYSTQYWSTNHRCIHIRRIKYWIDELRSDSRWTPEMNNLFKNIIKSNELPD